MLVPQSACAPGNATGMDLAPSAAQPSRGNGGVGGNQLTIVDIPFPLLDDGLLAELPPADTVLSLRPDDATSTETLARARAAKARGFRFMLSRCRRETKVGAFIPLCEFLSIDFASDHGINLDIVKALKRYSLTAAASNLASWEEFDLAVRCGFDLFGGSFFHKVELGSNKVKTLPQVKLNLMRQLSKSIDEIDINEVIKTVSLDANLCIQLLRMVNSAAFSLPSPVDSISHAVRVLGMAALKQWISVAMLSELDSSDKGQELMFRALHRATFLSQLSQAGALQGMDTDRLFLLGMLSCADALFGVEMVDLTTELQLPEDLSDALCAKQQSEWAWVVSMLQAIEDNRPEEARRHVVFRGLDPMLTARLYMSSCRLVDCMLKGLA
ncbi:hypothetical protein NNJEOMEG_00105 [Fundidesulfovibrio magnetotacticus]|uniref:HDOD domain-containing protein n=1 Tax=Fundidesulfovibrio magnetotacticus TaxID=2730080 RepID=A0A6V8LHT5_9BACT|nr:HDOD domain-containing protein [Fundidesulfovibrio magnetotacticus]GFK92282.1 hypothetical protein NNJEOMEG_00105 [Fundidesulfovibrio magnetotacticus]